MIDASQLATTKWAILCKWSLRCRVTTEFQIFLFSSSQTTLDGVVQPVTHNGSQESWSKVGLLQKIINFIVETDQVSPSARVGKFI